MIIGNPLALGGGNLLPTDAVLRVQAPAGSTVTITKGTTTKTDEGHENADDNTVYDYYFIIHASQFDSVNAWTVTATDGTNTATDTIIINAAEEFDLFLDYIVPSIYQRVEYLENTGSQYIDTGIGSIDGADADFQYTYLDANESIFGARNNDSGSQRFSIVTWASRFSTLPSSSSSLPTWDTSRHTCQFGSAFDWKVFFDGTQYGTTGQYYATLNTILFASTLNSNSSVTYYGKARIYSIKLYQGTTMVREFVPCYRKSDSVAGMWDRVGKTFYTNSGTGTFTVGGDVN